MIELDELKERLGEEENDAHDDVLELLEVAAVEWVQTHTGRYYGAQEEHTEYLDGTGTREMWLRDEPWAASPPSVDALVIEEESTAGTWVVIDTDDYVIRDYRLIHDSIWTRGRENYRATFTRGYAEGEEPPKVREAVIALVEHWWGSEGNAGIRSETLGDYSYTVDRSSIPERVEALLAGERWIQL